MDNDGKNRHLGEESLFGGDPVAGKNAEDVLREGLLAEDILFGEPDPAKDNEASEILGESVDDKKEISVVEKTTVDESESLKAEALGLAWYPELRADLREATRPLKVYVDPKATNKVRREQSEIDADKVLIDAAKTRLKSNDIVIDLIENKETKKRVVDATRLVFDEVDESKIGNRMTKSEAETLLGEMNINILKIREENLKKKDKERVVEPDIPKEETPDPTVEPTPTPETKKKETVGEFVRDNEVALNKFLLQDWNPRLAIHPDKTKLVKLVEMSKSIHKEALLDRFRASDVSVYEEMFFVAQDVYLKEILNDGNYVKIAGNAESIKRQEKLTGVVNTDLRNRFEGRLMEFVTKIYLDDKRRWFEYGLEGDEMRQNLGVFLINKFNKTELVEDKSEFGVIKKIFGNNYFGENIYEVNIKEKDDLRMTSEQRELVDSVSGVRNLARALDRTASFEALNKNLIGVDGAIKRLVNLKHPVGGLVIPKLMEKYMQIMSNVSGDNPNLGVDIDSEEVKNRLMRNMDSTVFTTETEKRLFAEIARDMIRITGMDVQFFVPENGGDPIKPVRGGGFLSGAINFEQKIKTKYSSLGELVRSVDFGVVPFWRKLERSTQTVCEDISEAQIVDMINSKFEGLAYTGWINSFEGVVGAQKAEEDFLKNPSVDNFVNNLPKAYGYKRDDAKPYLRKRFQGLVGYLIAKKKEYTPQILKNSIDGIFLKDGRWDDKGIFQDIKEYKRIMFVLGINTDTSPAERIERDNVAFNAGAGFTRAVVDALTFRWLWRRIQKRRG